MRKKIVIRIRRKNEFNWNWVFLLSWAVILGIGLLKANTLFDGFLIMFSASIVGIFALLYQGFEVVIGFFFRF